MEGKSSPIYPCGSKALFVIISIRSIRLQDSSPKLGHQPVYVADEARKLLVRSDRVFGQSAISYVEIANIIKGINTYSEYRYGFKIVKRLQNSVSFI